MASYKGYHTSFFLLTLANDSLTILGDTFTRNNQSFTSTIIIELYRSFSLLIQLYIWIPI